MTSPVGQTGLAEYSLALRAGTMLADQYSIVGVLGRPGGFGITYLAEDIRLESLVAIKEFLPRELATRAPDSTAVVTHAGDTDGGFKHGLEQFLREARTLAKIHHPSVVRVRQFFEANGTAYLVMDYLEGQTLNDLLKQEGGRIPPGQAVEIILRVLDGLRAAHALHIYHRDVKPSNIYITSSGLPVLLDFGAARQATGATSSKMTAVLTPGFAPLEQYGHRGQGPWTDIYAAAAVLYHAITGVDPVTATDRVGEEVDPMLPPVDIDPDIGQPLSDAIMKGLAMQARNRPQSADEFQKLLTAALAASRPVVAEAHAEAPKADAEPAPAPEAPRPRPTPSGTAMPFVPALADTLGPTDLASPEPLRRSSSGAVPVMPIVPSLADTLGPADLPPGNLPPTLPPSSSAPSISAPSLADTVAFWRPTPPRSTPPATPPTSAPPSTAAESTEVAPVESAAAEASAEPPAPLSIDTPSPKPAPLFVSDAFIKPPADVEVALRSVVESDRPRSSDSVDAAAVDHAVVDSEMPELDDGIVVDDLDEGDRGWVPGSVAVVPDDGSTPPAGGAAGGGARYLWGRATDTRQKRIGLAAVGLVVVVGTGLLLAKPRNPAPVAAATSDSATSVSTGETTSVIDSAAIRDSLAKVAQDSIRADSLKAVAAAKTKDSLARVAAAQRSVTQAARGTTGRGETARGSASTAYQDSVKAAETAAAQQHAAAALAATAEEHLRSTVDEFVNVLRSGDEAAIASALDEAERSAEPRASLLKFLHDRRPNVASVTPAEISLTGDVAQQYFTVKFSWRQGRIRRSDHADYAVFRASSRHSGGKWTSEKPEVTKAPETK